MKVAYVKWRDACHLTDDHATDECGLVDLDACGFLIREEEEFVTVAIEAANGRARLSQSIPRVNIIELRVADLEKAFPQRRRKSK